MKHLIRFTIESKSPGMLQNPMSVEVLESLRTGARLPKRTDWTIEQEAGTKLYRSEPGTDGSPGKMGIPMQNIISALIIAGQSVKSGKKALSTAKSTTLFDFLEFPEDFCAFIGTDADGNVPWKPFPVKGTMHNGAAEVAVCINRPRIMHWETQFAVIFDDGRSIDKSIVTKLVEIAGSKVGLGDWRPAKRGRFGRFAITKVEMLQLAVKESVVETVVLTNETAPANLAALAAEVNKQ